MTASVSIAAIAINHNLSLRGRSNAFLGARRIRQNEELSLGGEKVGKLWFRLNQPSNFPMAGGKIGIGFLLQGTDGLQSTRSSLRNH